MARRLCTPEYTEQVDVDGPHEAFGGLGLKVSIDGNPCVVHHE